MAEEGLDGDADAGGDGPAQVIALGGDTVEGRGRAEVHHDDWRPVEPLGGQGVDHPVGAHLLRVVVADAHPCLDPAPHDQRHRAQVALPQIHEDGRQGRHDAGEDAAVHSGEGEIALSEEIGQQHGVLVGRPLGPRGGPPTGDQLLLVVDSQNDIGVADVNGEQHFTTSCCSS